MMSPGRVRSLAALVPLLAAPTVAAQTVSGSAFVTLAEHRVDAGFGVEPSSGVMGGAAAAVSLTPRVELRLTALAGTLERDSATAESRDVAEVALAGRYRAIGGVVLEAGVATRTYTAAVARQRWSSLHIGAELRVPLLGGRVETVGRLMLLPLVAVTGLDQPDLAIAAAAGLDYHIGPVTLGLAYGLERYDFPTQEAAARAEQLSGLTVSARVRLLAI